MDRFPYTDSSSFLPKHSAETSLLNTANQLFLNINKGQYNLAIVIDLRKAFDTVNYNILLYKLSHYGVEGTEMKWFKYYPSNRCQYCSISGHV